MNADPTAPVGRQKYYSAAEVERLQAEVDGSQERRRRRAELRARETVALRAPAIPDPPAVRLRAH